MVDKLREMASKVEGGTNSSNNSSYSSNQDPVPAAKTAVAPLAAFARFGQAVDDVLNCFFVHGPITQVYYLFEATKIWFPKIYLPPFEEFKKTFRSLAAKWMREIRFHPDGLIFVRLYLAEHIDAHWTEKYFRRY